MFEKYDPGFLGAFIGVVMSGIFAFIFQQIKNIYRFSERLQFLKDRVARGALLSEHVQRASAMLTEGQSVPWYRFIKRHLTNNEMAKLILDIKETPLHLKIVIDQRDQQMVADMDAAYTILIPRGISPMDTDAAEETEVVHTDAVEEPEVVHTDAVEQTTIAEETGLRQRVGTRQKFVLKVAFNDETFKERAMKHVKAAEGVESVSVDMKTEKAVVVGKPNPVFLTDAFRSHGFAELLSVGPDKED